MTHADLVRLACEWLRKRRRFAVVIGDARANIVNEQPDAIGWNAAGFSVLIECKTSRADFRRDKRKHQRRHPTSGMGWERIYLAPAGVVPIAELPPGWGLLEVNAKGRIEETYASTKHHEPELRLALLVHRVRLALGGVNDGSIHARRFCKLIALVKGAP